MKLIPKQTALRWVKQQLKHSENTRLTLLYFKKDRQLTIEKQSDQVTILEQGFEHITYPDLSLGESLKLTKKLLEKEFPRSHNLYCQIHK